MKAEEQKKLVTWLIVAAVILGFVYLASRDSGTPGIATIAKQSDDRRTTYCIDNTGVQPQEGAYNRFDQCMDYLKMVKDGLLDPAKFAPPGSEPGAVATTVPADGTQCPPATTDDNVPRITTFKDVPPNCLTKGKNYTALFDTSEGVIEVALDVTKTPKTANNFIFLSRWKYYDDTRIFRTDPGLDIIQGGGMTNMSGPGYSIKDEGSGYRYTAGDLAMARTNEPNSAGGQFFFVTGQRASILDGQGTYVVFGKITKGLDVAQAIIGLDNGQGAPNKSVVVRKVRIIES